MSNAAPPDPKLAYLFEQLRALEVRRNYFGQLFWNTPSYFVGFIVLFLGFVNSGEGQLIWWTLVVGGLALLFFSFIALRLKGTQDEIEACIAKVEAQIGEHLAINDFLRMPKGRVTGARFQVVCAFFICGALLIALGLYLHDSHIVIGPGG